VLNDGLSLLIFPNKQVTLTLASFIKAGMEGNLGGLTLLVRLKSILIFFKKKINDIVFINTIIQVN
jgi:hypothetical protein